MKNLLPFLLFGIALTACENDPTQSEQYRQLAEDQNMEAARSAQKDSTINEMFGTFNRISENLRAIREKQGKIGSGNVDVELGGTMEERIMKDLESIDALLAENRSLIAKLRKDAKASASTIAELERTVTELERSLEEKDQEIGVLKEQLASTNSSLATLIEMYRDKEQLAALQRAEMNQAFYAVGTSKELRENGVLTKEGGVIGVGGVNKLNTNDMNTSYFKEIDVTVTKEIPVGAKKADLVSSHPEGSYTLTGEKLVIDDVEKFWSVGRYLVIVAE